MTTNEPTNLGYDKELEQEFKDYLKKVGYKTTSFSDSIFGFWKECSGNTSYVMATKEEAKEFVSSVSHLLRKDKTRDSYLRYMSNFFTWLGHRNLLCGSLVTEVAPTLFTHRATTYLTGRKPTVRKPKPNSNYHDLPMDDCRIVSSHVEGVGYGNVFVVYNTTAKPLVVGVATSEEEARLLVAGSAVIVEVPINTIFNLQFHDLSLTKNVISMKVV